MSDAMKAEFDTVAAWTAEVALDLGPEFRLPAACRGSGSPGTLRWLIDRLGISAGDRMLDCGAGLGGPAAFAAAEVGVRPILSEPEFGACDGARRLFGLPVVQAGSTLPFPAGSMDVVWSLGVLCTVADQQHLLDELHRVVRPAGRVGLLVFVAQQEQLSDQPDGNTFPTETGLRTMTERAGLRISNSASMIDYDTAPPLWSSMLGTIHDELDSRHHDDPAWGVAQRQSTLIGRLLGDGELVGTMLIAERV